MSYFYVAVKMATYQVLVNTNTWAMGVVVGFLCYVLVKKRKGQLFVITKTKDFSVVFLCCSKYGNVSTIGKHHNLGFGCSGWILVLCSREKEKSQSFVITKTKDFGVVFLCCSKNDNLSTIVKHHSLGA